MKWEYMATFLAAPYSMSDTEIMLILNNLGEQGWELVGVHSKNDYGGTFYFKRQKKEAS